jgi:hypothetical protein
MRAVLLSLGLLVELAAGCGRPNLMAPQAGAVKEAPQAAPAGQPAAEAVPRKIIYTAQADLVVEDLDEAEQQLMRFVKEQGGYVARSEVQGSPGWPRTGSWTVRVPVDHFNAFTAAVAALGELRHGKTDSDDITDRYYDLGARIKNKRQEEEQLLEHLKKSTGSLKDILAVEENLSRVRGEIEQMQGQLQRWDKETALATVTVVLHDRKGYVPPTSPAFGTSIGRTFTASLDALGEFFRLVILAVVAVTPWALVLGVVAVPVWLARRRYARRPRAGNAPAR